MKLHALFEGRFGDPERPKGPLDRWNPDLYYGLIWIESPDEVEICRPAKTESEAIDRAEQKADRNMWHCSELNGHVIGLRGDKMNGLDEKQLLRLFPKYAER